MFGLLDVNLVLFLSSFFLGRHFFVYCRVTTIFEKSAGETREKIARIYTPMKKFL